MELAVDWEYLKAIGDDIDDADEYGKTACATLLEMVTKKKEGKEPKPAALDYIGTFGVGLVLIAQAIRNQKGFDNRGAVKARRTTDKTAYASKNLMLHAFVPGLLRSTNKVTVDKVAEVTVPLPDARDMHYRRGLAIIARVVSDIIEAIGSKNWLAKLNELTDDALSDEVIERIRKTTARKNLKDLQPTLEALRVVVGEGEGDVEDEEPPPPKKPKKPKAKKPKTKTPQKKKKKSEPEEEEEDEDEEESDA